MSGKLNTHVLGTANGCPAANIAIALWFISDLEQKTLLKTATTNADGRTDHPLLATDQLKIGIYQLFFSVGDYFAQHSKTTEPPFLNQIPLQFGIADPTVHYHVPLLVSPWSYSTYRGS